MASKRTTREAKSIKKYEDDLIDRLGDPGLVTGGRQADRGNFPAKYLSKQEREKALQLKEEYLLRKGAKLGVNNVNVNYTPDAEDIKIWIKKDEELNLFNFEKWLELKMLSHPNLYNQKWVRTVYPEYYEKRLELIDQHLDIQKKIAMIKLYGGPRDKEDLMFIWAIENNEIMIPDRVAFDTSKIEKADQSRGFLNIHRWADYKGGMTRDSKPGLFNAIFTADGVKQASANRTPSTAYDLSGAGLYDP